MSTLICTLSKAYCGSDCFDEKKTATVNGYSNIAYHSGAKRS